MNKINTVVLGWRFQIWLSSAKRLPCFHIAMKLSTHPLELLWRSRQANFQLGWVDEKPVQF